jgi:hypothetical protein
MWGGDDPDSPVRSLALAGGQPLHGPLLKAVALAEVVAAPAGYLHVLIETEGGLALASGLKLMSNGPTGSVGLLCDYEPMPLWPLCAILVEIIPDHRLGQTLNLPDGPSYRIDVEITKKLLPG